MTTKPAPPLNATFEVEAPVDEVFAVLEDLAAYPSWWPSVFCAAQEVFAGGDGGVGRVLSFATKGWAPGRLRWSARLATVERPRVLALEAFGDLEGPLSFTLEERGSLTVIAFAWAARVEGSLPGLAGLVAPSNLRWAVAQCGPSLDLEVRRRRAANEAERAAIAAAPRPTPSTSLPFTLGAAGLLSAVAGAAVLWRKHRDS